MRQVIPILLLALSVASCTDSKSHLAQIAEMKSTIDSLQNAIKHPSTKGQIATFFTFQDNNSENAMNFYMSLFDNSKVIKIERWEKGGPGKEGAIMHAIFSLNGNLFMATDSPAVHDWDFSPAVSNYIDFDNIPEMESLFAKLSVDGTITMPLNDYGFSQRFGWVIDQYGISWQLNVP